MFEKIAAALWGIPTMLLFLFSGLFFTVLLRFLQIRGIPAMIKTVCGKSGHGTTQQVSPFQSMCTALAASIGTGNIVGVCAALAAGGPGAVFWMCLSAFLGEATAYAENTLGVQYRQTGADGALHGGAMYTMQYGLQERLGEKNARRIGKFYAFVTVGASLGMGNAVQVNTAAVSLHDAFGIPALLTGIACAATIAVLLYKGRTAVAKTAERLVPVSCLVFFVACIAVICKQHTRLPQVCSEILHGAFGLQSIGGGFSASVLRRSVITGFRRGIFSNEAGLGTAVAVHAAAEDATAHEQGLRSMAEVFFDTVLMCSLTAVCVLCVPDALRQPPSQMFVFSLQSLFGNAAGRMVSVSLCLFAVSTLIGWSFFGRESAFYVFGKKGDQPFCFLFCAVVCIGSCTSFSTVWHVSDIMNALLAFPNLFSLFLLCEKVMRNGKTSFVIDKLKKRG